MGAQDIYQSAEVVAEFSGDTDLQPAESIVLEKIRTRLREWTMLDVGVGAGRTTPYFAPLADRYVGVDYAPEMIDAANRQYGDASNVDFLTCDARSMDAFSDDTFDFVLFSFNGLDYVSLNDRRKILAEIQRVAKPGACFCFSSHNLQYASRLFSFHWTLNPKALLREVYDFVRKRLENTPLPNTNEDRYAILSDGAHGFSIKETFYISPYEQLRVLEAMGCSDIKVYGRNGHQLLDGEIAHCVDPWVYYFCSFPQVQG